MGWETGWWNDLKEGGRMSDMFSKKSLAVGVDIGGTHIKLGLINEQGEVIDHYSVNLLRDETKIADIALISQEVANFIEKRNVRNQLAGVGVACPGILDTTLGVVKFAVNLGWNELPLVEMMQERLKLPVRLECDATAGAIGEWRYGAGMDQSGFLYVCLGTGVGASLVVDHHIYHGDLGPAINIGHTSVIPDGKPCKCGNRGCLEKYVSASAITDRVRMELDTANTILSKWVQSRALDSLLVYEAAQQGDLYSKEVFQEAGELLGVSLVNCLQLFGVGNIIIGGGFSQSGDLLLEATRKTVRARFPSDDVMKVNIKQASFPTTAGMLGAAANIFQ
ncbi:hypothetical protein ASG93_20795 [Paenibacillus sp. Soil787]|nr:hypothetical protein ASG93_20795 [Paenibacillus sp. Soil787]